jgi:inhibitor of KinA
MLEYRLLPAGDTALVVEFGYSIDRRVGAKVLALARRLDQCRLAGIIETVPTFRSLMVHYDPLVLPISSLSARIAELMQSVQTREEPGRLWRLPACYDMRIAPDLGDVASQVGLSADQVIECHSAAIYHVYMLGFLPGMAYLGDVPAELVLPGPAPRRPPATIPRGRTSPEIPRMGPCFFPETGRFSKKNRRRLSTNGQSLRGIRDLDNFSKSK